MDTVPSTRLLPAVQQASRSSVPSSRRCPDCGDGLKRILRSADDKARPDADRWRRYRCRSCAWQGLQPATAKRRRLDAQEGLHGDVALASAGRFMLLLVLAGLLTWGGVYGLQLIAGG